MCAYLRVRACVSHEGVTQVNETITSRNNFCLPSYRLRYVRDDGTSVLFFINCISPRSRQRSRTPRRQLTPGARGTPSRGFPPKRSRVGGGACYQKIAGAMMILATPTSREAALAPPEKEEGKNRNKPASSVAVAAAQHGERDDGDHYHRERVPSLRRLAATAANHRHRRDFFACCRKLFVGEIGAPQRRRWLPVPLARSFPASSSGCCTRGPYPSDDEDSSNCLREENCQSYRRCRNPSLLFRPGGRKRISAGRREPRVRRTGSSTRSGSWWG